MSVIVPTHDRRDLLARKLRALERQARETGAPPFEVIVVADACSDDTEAYVAAYAPPYAFRWTTTDGVHAAAARNRGAELSRGRVLLFSDDDVIPLSGWLAAHAAAHDAPEVVATAHLVLPAHLRVGVRRRGRAHWWNLSSASMSIGAELFGRVGGYDPAFDAYGGEDPELGYRLRALGARFVPLPDAVAEHWDEGYEHDLLDKAQAAGRAHARVWRKHGDARIALTLGIHPVLAAAKRLLLNGLVGRVVHAPWFRYERAYLDGARAELRRRPSGPADPGAAR